jgi:hypothetical protein
MNAGPQRVVTHAARIGVGAKPGLDIEAGASSAEDAVRSVVRPHSDGFAIGRDEDLRPRSGAGKGDPEQDRHDPEPAPSLAPEAYPAQAESDEEQGRERRRPEGAGPGTPIGHGRADGKDGGDAVVNEPQAGAFQPQGHQQNRREQSRHDQDRDRRGCSDIGEQR